MSKLELGHLIHEALRHALHEQGKLLKHKYAVELLPVIEQLNGFICELEDWYSGKYHLKDRSKYFLKRARAIEAQCNRISLKLWQWAPLSLVPIFTKICDRRAELASEKSYPKQLRAQFNNFRIGLLEQFIGARFLENNSDLGEEVERILSQYLERRLGDSIRVLRGGKIYDYEGHHSGQIDLIITPRDALGISPADTGGKYNVSVDQVIAAISVTSRLTTPGLRQRFRGLQGIPIFKEKDQCYAGLKEHAWPLCYIVGAESDELDLLTSTWQEEVAKAAPTHIPQMVLLLDSGYLVPGTACWPRSKWGQGAASDLHMGTGIYSGLGLAWLEVQLAGRNQVFSHRPVAWVQRLAEQLSKLELKEGVPSTYDPRQSRISPSPIHGIMSWGWNGWYIHNELELSTLCIGKTERIADMTLLDRSKPIKRTRLGRYDFEPRWFHAGLTCVKDNCCALEEWIAPSDRKRHIRRIVVFDALTGEEVDLRQPLKECTDLLGVESLDSLPRQRRSVGPADS